MAVRMMLIAGARPNFMKIASLIRHAKAGGKIVPVLVHTGQHYDYEMSKTFFEQLDIPEPDFYLGIGSGSHGVQTGKAIAGIQSVLPEARPDFIAVVGDVNSTLAGAVVAALARIPLVHVEAGYRTMDMDQPEEINRQVADTVSSYFFPSTQFAVQNLLREGHPAERIFMAGDINLDPMFRLMPQIEASDILEQLKLKEKSYIFSTLHRPMSVDNKNTLAGIMRAFDRISRQIPIVLPLHPRTRSRMQEFGLSIPPGIMITKPLPYVETVRLQKGAAFVITDSGGIQDETTVLRVPCLTLREHTERPETLTIGSNRLIGRDPDRIIHEAQRIMDNDLPPMGVPELWDGKTGQRVIRVLEEIFA